jgi:hypothetical protein
MKTYKDIDEAVKALEEFQESLLFGDDESPSLSGRIESATFAPHYYHTAIGNIEAAINQLKLAGLFYAREHNGNF